MQATVPGTNLSWKRRRVSPARRKFLVRGGAFALTLFPARPMRAFALPQAAGSSAAKPEQKPLTVEERVKKIIVEQYGVDEKEVVPSAKLREDLGADSLDLVELVMACEEAFDIEIPDKEICDHKWITVADVVRTVEAKIAQKRPAPAQQH